MSLHLPVKLLPLWLQGIQCPEVTKHPPLVSFGCFCPLVHFFFCLVVDVWIKIWASWSDSSHNLCWSQTLVKSSNILFYRRLTYRLDLEIFRHFFTSYTVSVHMVTLGELHNSPLWTHFVHKLTTNETLSKFLLSVFHLCTMWQGCVTHVAVLILKATHSKLDTLM